MITVPSTREILEKGTILARTVHSGDGAPPQDFSLIDDPSIQRSPATWSGFQAQVYTNPQSKQIWIAMAGTNEWVDMLAWPTVVNGYSSSNLFLSTRQIDEAVQFAERVKSTTEENEAYKDYTINVTGYSLGGTLSEVLGETFGWKSVSIDGSGGGAIVTSPQYSDMLSQNGLMIKGSPGHVAASVDATLVGRFGNHIANTCNYIIHTDSGGQSEALKDDTSSTSWYHAAFTMFRSAYNASARMLDGWNSHDISLLSQRIEEGYYIEVPDESMTAVPSEDHLPVEGHASVVEVPITYVNNISPRTFQPDTLNPDAEILDNSFVQSSLEKGDATPVPIPHPLDVLQSSDDDPASSRGRGLPARSEAVVEGSPGPVHIPTGLLVLDMDGDGVTLSDVHEATVFFDANHDGKKEHTGWTAGSDGFLAMDLNGDGRINTARELISKYFMSQFGTQDSWNHGFEAFVSLDSNHDGVFDAADDAWNGHASRAFSQGPSGLKPLFDPELRVYLGHLGEQCTDILDTYEDRFFEAFCDFFEQARAVVERDKTASHSHDFYVASREATQQVRDLQEALLQTSERLTSEYTNVIRGRLIDCPWYERARVERYIESTEDSLPFRLIRLEFDLWREDLGNYSPVKYATQAPQVTSTPYQVYVWQDKDHDGRTDIGELNTLDDLGISSISLQSVTESGLRNAGNTVRERGTFVRDGEIYQIHAVDLTFVSGREGDMARLVQAHIVSDVDGLNSHVATDPEGEAVDVTEKEVRHAEGSTGDDTLIGDDATNWLIGRNGRDVFRAAGGDDVLVVDADDRPSDIDAGAGFDTVIVDGNRGILLDMSKANAEAFQGGRGDDTVFAGATAAAVIMNGKGGHDTLLGGSVGDTLSGEEGNDRVIGYGGDDSIHGHQGRDFLIGSTGNDIIDGGQGPDHLFGEMGDDVLTGCFGDDVLDGGSGDDIAQFGGVYADYQITQLEDHVWQVTDKVGHQGHDKLLNIEYLSFNDTGLMPLNKDALHIYEAERTITDPTRSENHVIHADSSFILPDSAVTLILTGNQIASGLGNDLPNRLEGNTATNILDGRRGDDVLLGGEGGDHYFFSCGSGVDTIQENDDTPGVIDTLQFTSGIHHDQIWFDRRGDDLELTLIGTEDKVIISDWYLARQHQVEQIISGDRKTLSFDQVETLRVVMDPFDPTTMGQDELDTCQQQILSVYLEKVWL